MTEVSIRGKLKVLPSFATGTATVVVKGKFLRTAQVFDEYWLRANEVPDPLRVIDLCKASKLAPDLFVFTQRVPNITVQHSYFTEWANVAVIPISSYEEWFGKQVTSATRRNIRAAANRGVVVKECAFDEAYVQGIMTIYNESPIRQGRKFWHYGKAFAAVQAENGTYSDRATFLAAYLQNEMIGYLKIVWDEHTAAIMQIMSKMKYYDKRPNNALLAEAVRRCCARGVRYLQYESFIYGNKTDSSLTDFKRNNGFLRMDVPRYLVPLTTKGALALRLGMHKNPIDRLPGWVRSRWSEFRMKWYTLKARRQASPSPAIQ